MKLTLIICLGLLFTVLMFSCQSESDLEFKRYYSAGNVIYQNKCQNCHGVNGEGLNGLIPPLTDTSFLKANQARLSCIVKYGLNDTITVANKKFEGQMPANDFAPIDIAEVLTYVTNSFGNKMGTITSQQVGDDLKSCK